MDADEYRAALRTVLDGATPAVTTRLGVVHDAVTEQTEGIVIEVFVDQDGEGPFDVWARFVGSDAFTLDQLLDVQRHLFGVTWGAEAWDPAVPPCPREWSRDAFEAVVVDVVDVVAEWIDPLIPAGSPKVVWELGTTEGSVEPRLVGAARD